MSTPLSRPLSQVHAELDAASERARRIVASLPASLLGRRPGPASWSVADCLRHLTLTTDAYLPSVREALADGRRRNLTSTAQRFRMDLPARLLGWWLEPPYRLKTKTGAAFVPAPADPAEALPQFLDRQQRLFDLLAEADGLAIDRLRIPSPFASQVRYSVYSAFRLIPIHQRRHLWQAEQVARRVVP